MYPMNEADRRRQLEAAEAKGVALFDAVERAGFVKAGRSESAVDGDIYELARREFGVQRHWHKRLVRTGINTVCVYADDPPERVIAADDTVYLDFGPVFVEWQADIGRSYAVGSDPKKRQLVADLPRLFARVQAAYRASPEMTGAALYAIAQQEAENAGWCFGGTIAGHTILGDYSAPAIAREPRNYIAPGNEEPMTLTDRMGRTRHWILEIHLVERNRTFGGFYERLL
jgi:Xaa-Pro dipeptidase